MSDLNQKKIIVIDDSSFYLAIISNILSKLGFQNTHYFQSTVEGWKSITDCTVNGEPYDLLLTDINMEEFDGLDLISMIREEEQCNSLKIIVISSEAELIDIAHKLGANDYLVKPVESKDLKNSIVKVFSHQSLAKTS